MLFTLTYSFYVTKMCFKMEPAVLPCGLRAPCSLVAAVCWWYELLAHDADREFCSGLPPCGLSLTRHIPHLTTAGLSDRAGGSGLLGRFYLPCGLHTQCLLDGHSKRRLRLPLQEPRARLRGARPGSAERPPGETSVLLQEDSPTDIDIINIAY